MKSVRAKSRANCCPGCFITLSSEIYPQYREYERTSTTVVNACLGPRVSTYLERMSGALTAAGIKVPLHMMQSNGGIISWAEATKMPCRIVESGPAAGVIAAAHFGGLAGRKNLISFDMGGTTAKAGLIENGEVRQSPGQELGAGINISRILQGGGYYVGAATVDLAEVGAGGGSIAWLDSGGILKVGPHSAGADPGPIAYGLGGDRVTVSDANFLLGRIPAEYFLGGEMKLDLERARRIVQEQLAKPLNITVEEACAAVVEVANANMLKMLRIVTVEKGCDPADFTIVAFGGNGAVHGIELAADLGVREVIVPPAPGLLSAQGLLVRGHSLRLSPDARRGGARRRYWIGRTRVRRARTPRPRSAAALRPRRQRHYISALGRHALPPPGVRNQHAAARPRADARRPA
jgi:N-methylhydantoinase A/oxoprolinase/acetone carboxylase beta subunit